MAEKKPPRAVAATRTGTDLRRGDKARTPKKVVQADASTYKMIKPVPVTKKAAGRPKKPH